MSDNFVDVSLIVAPEPNGGGVKGELQLSIFKSIIRRFSSPIPKLLRGEAIVLMSERQGDGG